MSTPEVIVDLSTACRRFLNNALQMELDGTPDTLPLVDHYLSVLRKDEHREDVTGMVVPAVGAYFGEVARTVLDDGLWSCPQGNEDLPDYASWRLICQRQPLRFNPLGISLECAVQTDAAGWGAHLDLPEDKLRLAEDYLSSIGDHVRSDDYYRLSVRLEVLESVYQIVIGSSTN